MTMQDAFVSRFGKPDPPAPGGVRFSGIGAQMMWEEIEAGIGAGWFMNRFLYLFGTGLDALNPCLEAWSFLLDGQKERVIVGRNAYGALLVMEEPSEKGMMSPVRVLDPLQVRYWGDPNLAIGSLIGTWLPENLIPGFLDTALYDAAVKAAGIEMPLDEGLMIKQPLSLGGTIAADNFQVEDVVEYYKTTGPIYAKALKKK